MRLIAGVYRTDEGTVLLDGENTFQNAGFWKAISFVPDEVYFEPGATITTMKQLYESLYDFDGALMEQYCGGFDLDPSKPLIGSSKGMKRRVAILFALCTHPKLLLLDGAYDGLEPLARLQFKRILVQRIEKEKLAVMIASHSLRELEDICDSFGIAEDGVICEYGDLIEKKGNVNKYPAAFEQEVSREQFTGLDILNYRSEGRVVQMVIRGEEEKVCRQLQKNHPILLDVLPVTFEELFIYELETRGGHHE